MKITPITLFFKCKEKVWFYLLVLLHLLQGIGEKTDLQLQFSSWHVVFLTILYPSIFKFSSSNSVSKLRKVWDMRITSNLWVKMWTVKRKTLLKLWADTLFTFQWQIDKLWHGLGLGSGFSSTSKPSLTKIEESQIYLKYRTAIQI